MPKINNLKILEDFQYAVSHDLSILYYYIRLTEDASILRTIFLPNVNTITSVYQWELASHQKFSNTKLMIYSKYFNLSVLIYIYFWFL